MPLFLAAQEAAAQAPDIDEAVLWAIIASPLVGWGLIALYVRKMPTAAGWLAAIAVGISMVLAYVTLFKSPPGREHYEVVHADLPALTVG